MKILFLLICILFFTSCTINENSDKLISNDSVDNTSGINHASSISSENSSEIVTSQATSNIIDELPISEFVLPEGQCLINPIESSLDINLDLLKKQILIDNYFYENPPYPYQDYAYYKFCDINADGYTDLIWSQQGYRNCDVNIYSFKNMNVVPICQQIMGTSKFIKNIQPDKFKLHKIFDNYSILETNYYDIIGVDDWASNYRYKRFFSISNDKIDLIADPVYRWFGEGNPEFKEDCYLSANGRRDNIVSVDEFDKYVTSLTYGAISSEEFILDNYVKDYLEDSKLSDALVKAYEEYKSAQ